MVHNTSCVRTCKGARGKSWRGSTEQCHSCSPPRESGQGRPLSRLHALWNFPREALGLVESRGKWTCKVSWRRKKLNVILEPVTSAWGKGSGLRGAQKGEAGVRLRRNRWAGQGAWALLPTLGDFRGGSWESSGTIWFTFLKGLCGAGGQHRRCR